MDRLTPDQRSANMRQIKSAGMKPELLVRRLVHGMGFRYRLHRADLPGKPDLVFPARRKVIFVHGCFWHQHPDPACGRAHTPRSSSSYWEQKLARNVARDAASVQLLNEAGWEVATVWECELRDQSTVAAALKAFLIGGDTGADSPSKRG
jgi:DNA mismatch endonuclease (patch repair protein)